MHYLAVRSVNPETQRFYPLFQFNPLSAYMIWMIRLLMLEVAVSEKGWPEQALESRKKIGAVAWAVAECAYKL